MSNTINTISLPTILAVRVACGKVATGQPVQYETVSLDISGWTAGQAGQWLAAGLANIAGDRIANAAKDSGGLTGAALINYKREAARNFVASLSAADAFPGRKPAEKISTAKAKLMSLGGFVAMLSASLEPDDLGMTAEQFAAVLPGMAKKMRDKRIIEMGRNPATYDAEEAAKAAAPAVSEAAPAEPITEETPPVSEVPTPETPPAEAPAPRGNRR